MSDIHSSSTKRHLLTVLLEDYFHVGAFNGLIERANWYRFETRFESNTLKTLDLLDRFDIKATFFVLGWIADRQPQLVREVAARGHEIASRGYYHRSLRHMTPQEFREDLARSREALERAGGTEVIGYRAPRRWSLPLDSWALDVLAEEGYAYDSSVVPTFRSAQANRCAYRHRFAGKEMWEFPVTTCNVLGWPVPIAGGNFSRQIPHTLLKHLVGRWHRTCPAPFVMYFHVWELDPEQPRINGAPTLAKLRHYRKLDKMAWVLDDYFSKYRFVGVADYLGLSTGRDPAQATTAEHAFAARPASEVATEAAHSQPQTRASRALLSPQPVNDLQSHSRTPISVVVPCFNEELTLGYLANTLKSVEAVLEKEYELRLVLVDDCSSDQTWEAMRRIFGARPNCLLVRHKENQGVAAAIMTGIRYADTEIVCSMDCDCTYDPHHLLDMIPKLAEGVDLVTASPYHPQGGVRNVPGWRLGLSRGSSWLYRRVLRQKLFTYTSCFRVYRKTAVVDLRLREKGFLGVAELLGRLDLQRGSKIVEHPAMLEVRLFGQSKMKVVKTVAGHLKLLARLLAIRVLPESPRIPKVEAKSVPLEENNAPDVLLKLTNHNPHTISTK